MALGLTPSRARGQFGGPAQVEVAPIVRRSVSPTTRLVGTVNAKRRSILAAEVAGAVVALSVDIGDRVRKQEILCRLRDSTQQIDLTAAEARHDEWRAELAIEEANLAKARFEKERIARLASLQRSTEKEVNDSEADMRAAEQRVSRAQARIAAAAADVARARDRLERMEIKAPFDAVVVRKLTELGQWVDTGGEVLELLDLSTARARVNVHESAIAYCVVGQNVKVTVAGLNQTFNGVLARIVPDADLRARTFPVEIDIENSEGRLRAGMFVDVALPSGPSQDSLVVPKDAVVVSGSSRTIWIARPNDQGHFAAPVAINVLAEADAAYAVSGEGLAEGDLIIVRGNESLRGPGPVIIRKPHTQSAEGIPPSAPSKDQPARPEHSKAAEGKSS